VLVHNAGAVNSERRVTVTVDGVEATRAVNHLAPFLLTELLADLLHATADARVVTVSSYMHTRVKHIPWDDLQSEHAYSAAATYNLTKLMNILFTYQLGRRWATRSTTANACTLDGR
jgi:NAD(P)-dependent dehydrogenase (short-subunit alcohol dehydrogenase family)